MTKMNFYINTAPTSNPTDQHSPLEKLP